MLKFLDSFIQNDIKNQKLKFVYGIRSGLTINSKIIKLFNNGIN